jgi:hypothetical protein
MRCQFSLPAEKVGAISSQSGSAVQDMKDEYGDMDCSGETFITKNFELESGHVLSEAHVRLLLPMLRSRLSSSQKLQGNFTLFASMSCDSLDRNSSLILSLRKEFSISTHYPSFKNSNT